MKFENQVINWKRGEKIGKKNVCEIMWNCRSCFKIRLGKVCYSYQEWNWFDIDIDLPSKGKHDETFV